MVALNRIFCSIVLVVPCLASPSGGYGALGRNMKRQPGLRDDSSSLLKRDTDSDNSTAANLIHAYWSLADGLTLPVGLHKRNNAFTVRADIQTSNFTVLSADCNATECSTKQLYSNSSESATSALNSTVEVFIDDIFFNDVNLNLTNQTIIASRGYLPTLNPDSPVAGILGLGASNVTIDNASALFTSMPPDTVSTNPSLVNSTDYFGLYLDRSPSLPSLLCIDCLDSATLDISQPIYYSSLRPDRPNVDHWHLQNASINATFGSSSITLKQSVFDTVFNTTLEGIFAPNHVVEEFYQSVPGSTLVNITWQGEPVHAWRYNCIGNSLVHAHIQWSGTTNNGLSSTWSMSPSFNLPSSNLLATMCQGALMAPVDDSKLMITTPGKNITIWQLGTVVLDQFYGVFDRENQRVGFGTRKAIQYQT